MNKHIIISTIIIINIVTLVLICQINYSLNTQTNVNFIMPTSILLEFVIILFSGIIIHYNKKTNSLLNEKIEKIMKITDELVISQRFALVGELSSRLAHEIRNPLSIIQTTLENLKMLYGENPDQKKQFEKIQRSIFRMTHQIEDVLDFVKEKHLKTIQTTILDIIADALDSVIIPNDIKLILPKNNAEIVCDKRQLAIVFNNLILNAIHAMNNVGILEITVEENKDVVIIKVKDDGKGIPEEEIGKIFEPLFTTKQTGTGLGLSSVKTIINSHRGMISVTSPPTIFTITLPKTSDEIHT